ncbi:MAG: enoyl-CoA hydratase-related protein [Candidatus Glassbacteria bacterium]
MSDDRTKPAFENVLFEFKNQIAYVTINRPKVLNALNLKTILELMAIFSKIKSDNKILGCILTGAGQKAFVAGADINEIIQQMPISGKDFSLRGQGVFNFIEDLGKPVIAAVNGYALGGGCEIAMACTMRIASENAKFGQPEVSLGIIPGYGGTQRLPRLIGKGRAMELILTGEAIDAQEAYRIGLVNKVVPPGELISSCEELLQKIFTKGPLAVRLAIEAVNHGLRVTLHEGLYNEASLFGLACATEDMREGTKAFIEKREAKFKGR